MSRKTLLALAGAAALLGGCATYDPYYDGTYAYDSNRYYYDRPTYRYYDYGPAYYPRPYVPAPSLSFGLGYSSGWRRY